MAIIHGRWWNDERLKDAIGLRDEQWYQRRLTAGADIATRFLDELGPHATPAARTAIADVVGAHSMLLRRHDDINVTVAHGDAHCWNFLNPNDPRGAPAILIDWECWDIEPGTHDLAALMALHWFADMRRDLERPLLERYHRGLQAAGVDDYAWDTCWNDYRFSVSERVLSPLYQWNRGRPVTSWWPNLVRITTAYHELECAELFR